MSALIFKDKQNEIVFNPIDKDGEMEVCMKDSDGNTLGLMYLSSKNLKSIQDYISKQFEVNGLTVS